jgi:hypothetical protein
VFSIKALAIAAAVSAGVVFAMPATSQAASATVKIHTDANSHFKNKSASWVKRHCMVSNDVKCVVLTCGLTIASTTMAITGHTVITSRA